jgi:hypothetical protein
VSTLAGSGQAAFSDGTGTSASFNQPWSVAVGPSGNIYVMDSGNGRVRKITPAGVVTTLATGQDYCYGIAVDASENIYETCEALCPYLAGVRKIAPDGTVTALLTGVSIGCIALDHSGTIYVSTDFETFKFVSGSLVAFAGTGSAGYVDGLGTGASFGSVNGMTCDAQGNLFVSDGGNALLRKITPAGVVSTFAGVYGSSGSVDGPVLSARFESPTGIAMDLSGDLYIADTYNQLIRKIQPCQN